MPVLTSMSAADGAVDPPVRRQRVLHPAELAGLVGWSAVVLVAVLWGRATIVDQGLGVNAAPLVGRWEWEPSWRLLVPVALSVAVVAWGPRVAARARWGVVVLATGAAAAAWTLGLAASEGWGRVTEPLTTRHDYEPFAARIDGVGTFLERFVENLGSAPIHVQGHPPGAPLVPWALDGLGLAGAGWFAAVVIGAWGVAVGAALVAARRVAGESAARRAAPLLVLLPAALWAGTSADALFAAVVAVGVALAVGTRRRDLAAGGVVLGLALLLTYGALAAVVIPAAVQLLRRRPTDVAVMVGAAIGVLALTQMLSGFSWTEGLDATRSAYRAGVAGDRPGAYFAVAGNPGALALAVGPAVGVGLVAMVGRWRSAAARLPLLGLATVALANASLLSKGEVERIWLLFVPWLALAGPGDRRGWLAAQAAIALVLQAWLRSKW